MNSFTNDELKALFTRVMDRMVVAGWLHRHTFTEGKGFHLTWTVSGAKRTCLLKSIAILFPRNVDADRAPVARGILAQGAHFPAVPRPTELDPELAEFWRQGVAELGLVGDPDGLLGLVHVLLTWAPDSDTPMVFGSPASPA